uniref:HDC00783 n=1 Tax=Drosophila melanogaster TaxID=7227 RepID=Q6IHV4_DROME|nr:TPA_inf: HDC00783 [Drosophila melanogaster]
MDTSIVIVIVIVIAIAIDFDIDIPGLQLELLLSRILGLKRQNQGSNKAATRTATHRTTPKDDKD